MSPLTRADFSAADGALAGYGRTLVMGVLNVTPDSFTDGGRFQALNEALRHASSLITQGADILDIGGESTRPNAIPVTDEEELARIVPVLDALGETAACPMSIDTYKARVAAAALARGAQIVNDVWGLQRDPVMADTIASAQASAVLMHNRETIDPTLDIVDDVLRFLDHSLSLAHRAGIPPHRLAVDPGIGFGKTLEQNLQLVAQLHRLRIFGVPILLGASRKSLIDKIIPTPPLQRIPGTIAVHTVGIMAGADLVRVHDVAEAVQACRVTDRIKSWCTQ